MKQATTRIEQIIASQLEMVKHGANRPAEFPVNTVKKVGILGAGMMGQGIAYVSALAGIQVVLKDISLAAADNGRAKVEALLDREVSAGRMDGTQKRRSLELITTTDADGDLTGCELILEAVFESVELKNRITATTEKFLSPGCIWGSNTSSLPITRLAEASVNPDRFIGVHFFSPVHRMVLVEIICGEQTSDKTLAKAFDYVLQIQKIPIVVNDSPGFFTSRVFGQQLSEAAQMLSEGIHPERIDTLAVEIGMPVGPLAVQDEISQQLSVEIMRTHQEMGLIDQHQDPTPGGTEVLLRLVREFGRGGRHHGGGYYDYSETGKQIWPKLIELYHKPEILVSDDDIRDRLLFRSVIESFKCLQEGVLRSVADGNIGSIFGIGAPPWTGGYLQYSNDYGLDSFVKRCNELTESYGDRFEVPEIVRAKAAEGAIFA